MNTAQLFIDAGLPGFAQLYSYIKQHGVAVIGSNSIGNDYADISSHIHQIMLSKVGIRSGDAELQDFFHSIGDLCGVLNFKGWKVVDGTPFKIGPQEYLDLLAESLQHFDLEKLQKFDFVCSTLVTSMRRVLG